MRRWSGSRLDVVPARERSRIVGDDDDGRGRGCDRRRRDENGKVRMQTGTTVVPVI